MTTIVYRDGILAFDSRISGSGTVFGQTNKGRQTRTHIMAGCGTWEDVTAVMDWLEAGGGEDQKKLFGLAAGPVDCTVITVDKNGLVTFYDERLYGYTIDHPWHSCGSGSAIAMGALETGVSAKEAVQIAAKYDTSTGGYIRTLSIKSLTRTKAKKKAKKK